MQLATADQRQRMMHLSELLFLLLALLLRLTSSADAQPLAGANAPDLVTETCKHTMYFDICMSAFQSNPQSATSDLKGLVAISIEASLAYAKETAAHMRKLKYDARHANQSEMWQCLRDCLEEYDEGMNDLVQAAEALKEGALDTVNLMVAGATTNADTCESGFQESQLLQSPVADRNGHLMKLCSNSMAVAKLLG